MALPVQKQLTYWGIAAAVFLAMLWFLGDVILPFIVGGAIAYFLDPLADRLERLGLSRAAATATISVSAALIFLLAALLLIPLLVHQSIALANAAPGIFLRLQTSLADLFPNQFEADSPLRQTLPAIGRIIQERGGTLLNGVLSSAMNVINALVFMIVAPVVAFYLLLDWDRIVAHIDTLLPRDHAETIRTLMRDIDTVLAGFVRGQLSVCGVLAIYYAGGLMLVGMQFGMVVGAVTGMISFIPYIGAIVGGVLAIGLALFQFWNDPIWIAVVIGLFFLGQMLEGNVLVPKLVGGSVGLHPVWLLFALSAFGSIFGFVGMMVAVPVAAAIGVLSRFGIAQYKTGRLYRGLAPDDD